MPSERSRAGSTRDFKGKRPSPLMHPLLPPLSRSPCLPPSTLQLEDRPCIPGWHAAPRLARPTRCMSFGVLPALRSSCSIKGFSISPNSSTNEACSAANTKSRWGPSFSEPPGGTRPPPGCQGRPPARRSSRSRVPQSPRGWVIPHSTAWEENREALGKKRRLWAKKGGSGQRGEALGKEQVGTESGLAALENGLRPQAHVVWAALPGGGQGTSGQAASRSPQT